MGFGGRGITLLYVRHTARKPRVSIRDISMRFEMSYTMSPGRLLQSRSPEFDFVSMPIG